MSNMRDGTIKKQSQGRWLFTVFWWTRAVQKLVNHFPNNKADSEHFRTFHQVLQSVFAVKNISPIAAVCILRYLPCVRTMFSSLVTPTLRQIKLSTLEEQIKVGSRKRSPGQREKKPCLTAWEEETKKQLATETKEH